MITETVLSPEQLEGFAHRQVFSLTAARKQVLEIEQAVLQSPEIQRLREAAGWISVSDRLPEIGAWANVLLDRNEGDFFERNGKPRYSVYGAQLREVDSEGYAMWQRWKMSDGGPMHPLYLVTHWMPLPPPPTE